MKIFIDWGVYTVGRMQSGRLYAELISNVGWEFFPNYAEGFVDFFSGTIIGKSDSVDTRIWELVIDGQSLRLVYEDFPVMISLESQSEGGDRFIEGLKEILTN